MRNSHLTMSSSGGAALALLAFYTACAFLPLRALAGQEIAPQIRKEAEEALTRGVAWLLPLQHDDGSWSNTNYPALTALPLWALLRSNVKELDDHIQRAVDYIVACESTSGIYKGAIYRPVQGRKGGGLLNYNTAICLRVLHAVGGPRLTSTILNARDFLARSQYLGDEVHYGGLGYDPPTGRPYADLSNSYLAYEAMRLTQDAEDLRQGKPVHLDWDAALTFIQRCQNDPRFNDLAWASDDPDEQGGFAYRPDTYRNSSGAFEQKGVTKFRSMPGMTYAGLLSYIYAGVSRDDPRVRATVHWIQRNWQVSRGNRNPEMRGKPEEKEGLYYMYNVLAKGLNAYGQDVLTLGDGSTINWRNDLLHTLVSLQKPDGFWVNDNGRYWENDKVLVTSYALLAVETALGR